MLKHGSIIEIGDNKLFDYISLVPNENIFEHMSEAKIIMGDIDPEDVAFIAAGLSSDDSIIWSDDKDFEKQNRIKVLKTREIIKILDFKK